MFQDLCTQVEVQETAVEAIQNDTEQTKFDLENANTELTKTIGYRRLARRYKWWIFLGMSHHGLCSMDSNLCEGC
jgi:t-SNARE complex subunit (syntaxin)